MLVYQRVKAVAGGEAAEKLRMDDVPTLSQSTLAMKLLQFFLGGTSIEKWVLGLMMFCCWL